MSALTTRFEDLAAALVAHAAGVYRLEAAVRLLIGDRRWLEREDFLTLCVQLDVDGADGFAGVDWMGTVTALGAGRLPCSSGERQVLLLAAGLAGGVPVDLRDALTSIDHATAVLVAETVAHAAGLRRCAMLPDGGSRR